jgi:hypothetical protein
MLAVLTAMSIACGNRTNKKKMDMTDWYEWAPGASAPYMFPTELRYAYFLFGDSSHYPITYSLLYDGMARSQGTALLDGLDRKLPLPYGFCALWMAREDRKVYGIDVRFTEEQKRRILGLFQKGFVRYEQKGEWSGFKRYTYDEFYLTVLPYGRVLLHVGGNGRIVYVDSFQGEVQDLTLQDLNLPYSTKAKNLQEYFDHVLTYDDYKPMLEYIAKHGNPSKIWDKYLEKFNYEIKIEFENKDSKLRPNYGYKFSNAELFDNDDGVKVEAYARIKRLVCSWRVEEAKYTGYFYFDENEVLEFFDKAYGKNHQQKGEFLVWVSKYNNRFKITLRVGEREYEFKKTKIHVFKVTPENKDDDDHLFYNNHRDIHSSDIKFIGE